MGHSMDENESVKSGRLRSVAISYAKRSSLPRIRLTECRDVKVACGLELMDLHLT